MDQDKRKLGSPRSQSLSLPLSLSISVGTWTNPSQSPASLRGPAALSGNLAGGEAVAIVKANGSLTLNSKSQVNSEAWVKVVKLVQVGFNHQLG